MLRSPSPWIVGLALSLGVALGLAAGRWGAVASAQQGPAPAPTRAPSADAPTTTTSALGRAAAPEAVAEEKAYRDLARQYEAFQGVDRAFALVAKVVSPAVVHIVSRKGGQRDDGSPIHYEESGSGVIVRAEGGRDCFVLTNNHVVEGAVGPEISIFLHDGRVLKPERFWADPKADVAVLRLGRNDLPAARMGNSDEAAIGHWVVALGSPFGLTHSVSHGIISARGRHEQELEDVGVENQDFLQTDAAINPGNSGGPLVNLKGEVIGINTAMASNHGGSEGVGFSIPINLAKWIMAQLVTTGKVSRGAMGVKLQELSLQKATELGLDRPRGARIAGVQKSSPAAAAGLSADDVVLRYNGVDVLDYNHFIYLVSITPIGQHSEVVFWRDRQRMSTRVTIADRASMSQEPVSTSRTPNVHAPLRRSPRPETAPESAPAPAASALGVDLLTLDASVAHHLNLPESLRGAVVSRVDPASPFASLLQRSDVITTVGGASVKSAEDVARALKLRKDREPLELVFQRAASGAMQPHKIQAP
jgi:serine protease Do